MMNPSILLFRDRPPRRKCEPLISASDEKQDNGAEPVGAGEEGREGPLGEHERGNTSGKQDDVKATAGEENAEDPNASHSVRYLGFIRTPKGSALMHSLPSR